MSKGTTKSNSVVRVTQTRIVGEMTVDPHGSGDILSEFAQIAMRDFRDEMRGDHESESVYEIDTTNVDGAQFGKVAITLQHDPEPNPPMTVAEAKAALTRAREYEREQSEPVSEQDSPSGW